MKLAKFDKHFIIASVYRGVEKLVSRQAHNLKITGSNPVPATKKERTATAVLFVFT